MKSLVKWLLILGVLFGGMAAAGARAKSWWEQRLVPKFITATITRGRVEAVVNSTGTVKPVLSVSVGAFTSGPIAKVYVDFNSRVTKDQVLAEIDPRLLQAAVDRDTAAVDTQKADLARIEALLQQAKNNEKRGRDLQKINKDYISDTDMDQFLYTRLTFEAQVKLATASIKQAEANLKNSEANLGYTKIIAPVAGTVIERKVDPGQTVAASFQTPELFILAPDMEKHMHVYASVDEADIGQIRAAQEKERPVKFTVDAYQGDLFEGKIYQIRKNPTTTQNVVTYPVVIEAPNEKLKLLPGMTANLTFQINAKEDVLRVPSSALRYVPPAALVRDEDKHYVEALPAVVVETGKKTSATDKAEQVKKRQHRIVWIQEGQLLRAVPVTLGMIENQFCEIVEADLKEGQLVVTGTESGTAPR